MIGKALIRPPRNLLASVCATEAQQCITVTANPISVGASSRALGEGELGGVGKGGALLRGGVHLGDSLVMVVVVVAFYHFCDGLKIGAFPQERRESLEQEEPLFCTYAFAYTAEAAH